MKVIDWLSVSGIIADIILFFIIAGNAVYGYRKGFARILCSFLSTIIAIVLVFILYKPVSNYMINSTNICKKLENIFEEKLECLFEKENNNVNNIELTQKNNDIYEILNIFVGDKIGNLITETKDSMIRYVSIEMSQKIVRIFTFLVLFAVIRLVLYVLRNYIEMVANVPVIRVFNGVGGMIYGILRGFFVIYLTFAIISVIMPIISNTIIITSIQKATIGSKMFNNNILLNLIMRK